MTTEEIKAKDLQTLRKLSSKQIVPSWGGRAKILTDMVKRGQAGAESGNVSTFPTKWFSPLVSFINFYIPWDQMVPLNSNV